MPIIATSPRRRIAMGVMLSLAVAGAVIRHYAPDPSAWRNFGTLLLVLWLPAVGNLVAYVVTKIPVRAPKRPAFAADSAFAPQFFAQIEPVPLPEGWAAGLDPQERRCTVVVGKSGFTARTESPLADWLDDPPHALALECLVPSVALRELAPGTAFLLSVGSTVVARGQVADRPFEQP